MSIEKNKASKAIGIKVSSVGVGQVWITFDAGEGRQAMLNLNNIVLARPMKGINTRIMKDALVRAILEEK